MALVHLTNNPPQNFYQAHSAVTLTEDLAWYVLLALSSFYLIILLLQAVHHASEMMQLCLMAPQLVLQVMLCFQQLFLLTHTALVLDLQLLELAP